MRVTYRRHRGNREYWNKRWQAVEADLGGLNLSRYPGLYAERALECDLPDGPMLEAGCGAGRVLLHYHRNGHPVVGFDFVHHALEKIRSVDGEVPLLTGDILQLPFASESFSSVMAFGVYHNLESGIEKALAETRRTLKPGGVLCASMRADNIQNQVIDWLATRKENGGPRPFTRQTIARMSWIPFLPRLDSKYRPWTMWRICRFSTNFDFSETRISGSLMNGMPVRKGTNFLLWVK